MYKLVKISKIANITTGFPFKGDLYTDEGIRVVRGENVTVGSLRWDSIKCWNRDFDQLDKYSLKDGDVVIGMDGSKVGKNRARIKANDLPLLLAQRVALLRSNKFSNQNFLYYLIIANKFEEFVERIQTGSSVPHISQKQIEEFTVPFISVDIQKKISDLLLSLDSKIELNNRINTELEALAKTLYDFWFVQFDFPNNSGKPYKASGGKMVWNELLKKDIPNKWEVTKVGDLLYTSLGGTPSTTVKDYWENGTINWLNSGEIANFPVIKSDLKITEAAIRNSATEVLPKGSVLLSITRHLRPTVLAVDACANQSVVGIKEKEDVRYYFLYPYLKNEIPRLNAMRSGAQQPHINKQIVDESFILTPNKSSDILKEYNSKVGPLYELIINNALQNQQLSSLRDWLLPMLMNGQVKVKDTVEETLLLAAEEKVKYE